MAAAGAGAGQQAADRGERRRGQGHRQKAAWLPLDVIAEIAARSDAATLVRCAATCRDARRRIAGDPSLLGRLRLRDTDRFVLPLLRGHLAGIPGFTSDYDDKMDVYMVDTAAAAGATRLVKSSFTKADEAVVTVSMDSRGGLVLVRTTMRTAQDHMDYQRRLLVCNMATRRHLVLPPEPEFPRDDCWYRDGGVQYVLLVGASDDGEGAAVGRPFQVLMAKLVLSDHRSHRRLLVRTFSSERGGSWSPLTEIPVPTNLHGSDDTWSPALQRRPLVLGDVVHWLCLTDSGSYMLILHVGAARVSVTSLPASFPRDSSNTLTQCDKRRRYLLATASAGGNPVVLVADADRISAWEQSKHTRMWKPQPQVVIENEAVLGFKDDGLAKLVDQERRWGTTKHVLELLSFGQTSGAVLLRIHRCLLWLDLQSKKIVRCFSSDDRVKHAQVYCSCELDLSSWVPTFSSAAVTL